MLFEEELFAAHLLQGLHASQFSGARFFPDPLIKKDWYCDIFTYTYTNIKICAIMILEVPELAVSSQTLPAIAGI